MMINARAQKNTIEAVANAIRHAISPIDVASYEIARYCTGVIVNMANEMNIQVGYIISRATLSTDYKMSSTEYINGDGKKCELSSLTFGKKLEELDKIAEKVGVIAKPKGKLSILRNLPAHGVIAITDDGRAVLWDKYDINAAFDNDMEKILSEFINEAEILEQFCKEIIAKMDASLK